MLLPFRRAGSFVKPAGCRFADQCTPGVDCACEDDPDQPPLPPAVLGYFCKACGVMHADSPPIVGPEALSVQQVRMVRGICELRASGDARTRELGLVEICALLNIDWRRH